MSKMKLALDVVQDLRNLADSLEALAGSALGESPAAPIGPQPTNPEPSQHTSCDDPATQSEPLQETPRINLVELRAFVAGKSTLENRPRIKAILDRFGVKKLTELSEDQYPALMREVEVL